jgi:ABC-type phosphate transport system substrate-binding protein
MNRLINTLLGFLLVLSFTTTSYSRDQIKIVGSSTVYPYATVVAEKFGKSGKFKTPVIESTGTGGGMKLYSVLVLVLIIQMLLMLQEQLSQKKKHYVKKMV